MFLTFLILTYKRPDKVARLLSQFLDLSWSEVKHLNLEIVIADDHSDDNTAMILKPIITLLENQNWPVKYILRKKNLRGDRNLYYGYTRDSASSYVWFLCDDDILVIPSAIRFIKSVYDNKPLIAICGFSQGKLNQYGNQLGESIRLINHFPSAVDLITQYPKTTAYILRRCPEYDLDDLFERWDYTLYSWIGIAIYLMAKDKSNGLLAFPEITAHADDEFGHLRYSYRIFGKLRSVVIDSIQHSGWPIDQIESQFKIPKTSDEINFCLIGLYSHYNWRSHVTYSSSLLEEEYKYLFKNWRLIFKKKERIISFIKLVIFYICHYAIPR